jgi:uncharacterized protein (TIGR04222 family)
VRRCDPAADLPPPLVPANPDPYEIAYLRGGENEVIRLAIFDLIQRGYLQIVEEQKRQSRCEPRVVQVPWPPEQGHLSPLEREVFDGFRYPRSAREVFQSSLPGRVKRHSAVYAERLEQEQLLFPEAKGHAVLRIGVAAAISILGLGGYKRMAALENGHSNVVFLILMGILALSLVARVCRTARLSRRSMCVWRCFAGPSLWECSPVSCR